MTIRFSTILRVFCQILIVLLQGTLLAWASAAPIVWIVRDGLGPDSTDSGWVRGIVKFLVIWGVPALILAVPLFVLTRIERWWARSAEVRQTQGPTQNTVDT